MGNGRTAPEGGQSKPSRCIAIVGPYLSGKSALFEAIIATSDVSAKSSHPKDKATPADTRTDLRPAAQSIEAVFTDFEYLGDKFTLIDLPGSIEFQAETRAILPACDLAIVVCEPELKRVAALQVTLKTLSDQRIPHLIFLNKIDATASRVRDIIPMLQPASRLPLVLRQIPIWNKGIAVGYVDLASERAFIYRDGAPSETVAMPQDIATREGEARFHMLEQLADHDDALMEKLLSDIAPPRDLIFNDLAREMSDGLICPVFLGSALKRNGITRLLKALRHEAPLVTATAARLGLAQAQSSIHVLKTLHQPHVGKTCVARILTGGLKEGDELKSTSGTERAGALSAIRGSTTQKRGPASAGDVVAIGRLDTIKTGAMLTNTGKVHNALQLPALPAPVYASAIELHDKKDEVKLSAALTRMTEEDPGLSVEHVNDTHQLILWGQGEMHMRLALDRLRKKYSIEVTPRARQIPYKETIKAGTQIRGRHKKQTGGHGQFGDVLVDIKPLPRGAGFQFSDKIHGGTVPKQYIPSVEIGIRDYLGHGPLGFPVVDVAVTLLDGSYHDVDSSDMAFRQAGRIAMCEGMPKCSPVLLEPIMAVDVLTPSEFTARINAIIAQRRGQLLGFMPRENWQGWDIVTARLPESEMSNLIVDIRSATSGVGSFVSRFDHLHELSGRLAEDIVNAAKI